MSQIAAYQVISEKGTKKLTEEVNLAINNGWQPQGGVSSMVVIDRVTGEGKMIYSQALIKPKS